MEPFQPGFRSKWLASLEGSKSFPSVDMGAEEPRLGKEPEVASAWVTAVAEDSVIESIPPLL